MFHTLRGPASSKCSRGLIWRGERGAAAVEFALLVVVLLTFIFGIIEGGWVFFNWLVVTNEAREGARWGAVRYVANSCENPCDNSCHGEQSVRARFGPRVTIISSSAPTMSVCNATASTVTVTVQADVQMITPLMMAAFGATGGRFHVSSTSVMTPEW